ncbi:MAG TPA: hypothetical protein QF873_02815 [Patescibacteria group bacterium]|nr:hypothetical protein [Patescibacteria group bacterium]
MKKEVTTEDLLKFMQDNLVTKADLNDRFAKSEHKVLDIMDRRLESFEQRMNLRFDQHDVRFDMLDAKIDFKFDTLTDVLQEKNVISNQEAEHLKTLKPALLKN